MAVEWSGYLKRAVATVERHLDEALEKPSSKTDLTRSSSHVESREPSEESLAVPSATEEADEETLLAGPTMTFPNLQPAVTSVQELALKLDSVTDNSIKDAGLDAVDSVEAAVRDHDAFVADVTKRMTSLCSKIKYLSNTNLEKLENSSDAAAKRERQIVLLLDEGQRLAQQELKLNTLIKKLRKASAPQVTPQVSAVQTAELEKALSELQVEKSRAASQHQALERQLAEQGEAEAVLRQQMAADAALLEHYRSLAEAGAGSQESLAADLQRRLDMSRDHHTAAADNWNNIETGLLRRIAELESALENDHSQRAGLLKKLQTTQQNLTEARDAANERAAAAEEAQTASKTAARHVEDLKMQVEQLKVDLMAQKTAAVQAERRHDDSLAEFNREREAWAAREAELVAAASVATRTPSFYERETSLGSIAASDAGTPPLSPIVTRRQSICSDVDTSAMFSATSSVVGPRSESGHMLGRLTMTVRRLETELTSTKHALELANTEKTEAFNELLACINASDEAERLRREKAEQVDQIAKLEATVDSLLVKLGEKSERVQELEADVQDLKAAYREQIEALLK